MARPWLKVEPALVKHRKTRTLARLWHCHPYQVVGFLVSLWGYCLEFQEDGDVTAMLDVELEELSAPCTAGAIGTLPTVREALREAGFLDANGKLHDWTDYTGGIFVTRTYDRTRQASRRRIQAKGSFTREDWRELLVLTGFHCAYCGEVRTRLGQGHVVPLSRGGKHQSGNVVAACKSCNRRKGNRLLAEAGMVVLPEVVALLAPTRFGLSNCSPNESNGSPKKSLPRIEQSRVEQSRPSTAAAAERSPTAAQLDYASRCVIAVNTVLERQLAGAYRPLVADVERPTADAWAAAGITVDLAERTCAERTAVFRATAHNRQPHTLRYFDAAVREAQAQAQGRATPSLALTSGERMRAAAEREAAQ